MAYDPDQHHRRSIRARGYDYRDQGGYFITLCVRDRRSVFGQIQDGSIQLSQRGHVVLKCWEDLPNHHPSVELDAFVVMPNHVHGILFLAGGWAMPDPDVGATPASPSSRPRGPSPHSLGAIIGSFKSSVSRNINRLRPGAADRLWQPNYYEHIIRGEHSLERIRQYIMTNPQRWAEDRENPDGNGTDDVEQFVKTLAVVDRPAKGDAGVAPTGGSHA